MTSDPGRRAELASEHPGARAVDSIEELWRLGDVDLLVIAAPNEVHAPLARQAIDHSVPVVVDKPLAVTSDDAAELVTAASRAGLLLTVFQNRRWDSDYLTLEQLIAEGRLGTVLRFESRFERWRPQVREGAWRESLPPERGGGQLLDLGSHLVDQAITLFGPVAHVYAEVDARRGSAADDDAFLALRHETGVISHLHASALTAAPGPRLRVLGSRAAYVVEQLDSQEDALRAGRRPGPGWGAEPRSHWGRLVAGEDTAPVPSRPGAWPRFYELLASALHDGGPPPVDPADAVAVLRVLEAARRSAAERSLVNL